MNNFFITKKQRDLLIANANEILPLKVRERYELLKQKYGLCFASPRKENAQRFWNYAVAQQNALPPDDPWRFKLELQELWSQRNTQDNLLKYMEYAGLLPDYYYLYSLETAQLEAFVSVTLPEYGIHLTRQDLLECSDFGKFFDQFLIENCDPKALKETERLKAAFDTLLKGKSEDEGISLTFLLQNYISTDRQFYSLHKLLNNC